MSQVEVPMVERSWQVEGVLAEWCGWCASNKKEKFGLWYEIRLEKQAAEKLQNPYKSRYTFYFILEAMRNH